MRRREGSEKSAKKKGERARRAEKMACPLACKPAGLWDKVAEDMMHVDRERAS